MLDIQNLSKTFNPGTVNEKKALSSLSLHLDAGDFVTIVGSLIYRFIYAVVFYTKIVPVECLKLLTAIIVALAIAAPSIQRWAAFQRRKAAAKGKGGN